MAAVEANRKGISYLWSSLVVLHLILFQVEVVYCWPEEHLLSRTLRSIPTPDYQAITGLQLHVPLHDPVVPFLGTLSEPLKVGSVIQIQGYVPPSSTREFQFNLCTDCSNGPIHLHVGVRFDENVVVRNSYENRQWKTEERNGAVPFAVNQEFDLLIEVRAEDYLFSLAVDTRFAQPEETPLLTVNGNVVWTFRHRVPFSTVEKFEIKGQPVRIRKIEYTDVENLILTPHYRTIAPLQLNVPLQPEVPFLGILSEHLEVGSVIRIFGLIPSSATREFEFNLCTDCSNGPIHLHVDVRLDEKGIVRNSYENGQWQTEERDGGNPFVFNKGFSLRIEVRAEDYLFTVNGNEIWTFKHRVPFSTVQKFEIKGQPIKILSMTIKHNAVAQIDTPDYQTNASLQLNLPIFTPGVPFLGTLSEELKIGSVIRIHGYVPPTSIREFQFNLCTDCSNGPIHLHMDVRFDENVVVRNSYENRQWKTEERNGRVPFAVNQEFVFLIEVRAEDYLFTVNGNEVWTFKHRVPFSTVEKFEIKGQPVKIWKIEYTDVAHQQEAQNRQVNGDVTNGMTINLNENPSSTFEMFTLDLTCQCKARSFASQVNGESFNEVPTV